MKRLRANRLSHLAHGTHPSQFTQEKQRPERKPTFPAAIAYGDFSKRWIMQVPVISTAHITKTDGLLFSDHNGEHVDGCMFAIFGGSSHILKLSGEPSEPFTPLEDFSEHANRLFRYLYNLGFRYVRLDPDGERMKGRPTFKW